MTLDYDTSLISKGFILNNPNATATCGCGTSFSVQGDRVEPGYEHFSQVIQELGSREYRTASSPMSSKRSYRAGSAKTSSRLISAKKSEPAWLPRLAAEGVPHAGSR